MKIVKEILLKEKYLFISVLLGLMLAGSMIPQNPFYKLNWALMVMFILCFSIIWFFGRFERGSIDTKQIAMIATLSSLAAISRVVLTGIVSVQPATFIIMISGYVLGAQTGFMIGALTAFVSNFFLGQGPWTPWQMIAWGICGMLSSLLRKRQHDFAAVPFIFLCGFSGYFFGALMNIWHWIAFVYPLNVKTFIGTYAASFIFDTMHATGNVIISALFGKSFYMILSRYAKYI